LTLLLGLAFWTCFCGLASSGDTFVEAYVQVVNSAGGWTWSSNLLLLVTPLCLWLHVDGSRAGVSRKHQLSFLVLGFFGAISAAFPLAFATVHAQKQLQKMERKCADGAGRGKEPTASGWLLGLPAAVAVVSALLLPYTVQPSTRSAFVAALAALHVVLLLPALFNPAADTAGSDGGQGKKLDRLMVVMFGSIAGAAAMQHWHNLAQVAFGSPVDLAFPSLNGTVASLRQLLAAGFSNSCQVRNSLTAQSWVLHMAF
jgi:hypothetical protein